MTGKPNAALYVRVSTTDKGQTVENQLLPLRERASARGYKIVREYSEHVSAAGTAHRKEFKRMMDEAKDGVFSVLLFWSLDRFSREGPAQTMLDLRTLNSCGVAWSSLQEPILDMANVPPALREMFTAFVAAIAKMESDRRRERAKAAVARKRAKGETMGRPKIDIPIVKLRSMLDQEYSMSAIARTLGVSRQTVFNWVRELGIGPKDKEASSDGRKLQTA